MGSCTEISFCRICANKSLVPILSLGTQALTGIFPRSKDERVTAGPVDLVKCDESRGSACGLVQLRQSYDKGEMYGPRYGYRSSLNPSMVRHLEDVARRVLARVRLEPGDLAVDIGSNDGTLLKTYPREGPVLVGIDPTGEQFRRFYPSHIELVADFFSVRLIKERFGGKKAKVVTSIAMFYDLERPMEFVAEVADILAKDGVWVLEQSYLPTMIEMTAYDTICHEHLEYYGLRQIKWMTDRLGLKIVDVEANAVNGGSFCVTVARRDSPYPECAETVERFLAAEAPYGTPEPYRAFSRAVLRHREELLGLLARIKGEGRRVAGYGASTKGNVILQFCGLSPKDLPCIGEVNRDKFGCFTPGTLIPIVPEEEARAAGENYLLVLPWHFRDFILSKEAQYLRLGGRLLFPLPRPEICSQ